MQIRMLQEDDLPEVLGWFAKRKWPRPPSPGILPKTAFVAEDEEGLVAATWIYLTNAQVAMIEWNVSNPQRSAQRCMTGLNKIVRHAKSFLSELDPPVNTIFHWTVNDKLAAYYEKRHGLKTVQKKIA